jgi:hypothetical protein
MTSILACMSWSSLWINYIRTTRATSRRKPSVEGPVAFLTFVLALCTMFCVLYRVVVFISEHVLVSFFYAMLSTLLPC